MKDLLELQRIWMHDSDWYWSSPLLDPAFFAHRAKRMNWTSEKIADYHSDLATLQELAARYSKGSHPAEREIASLAGRVVLRWGTNLPSKNTF